MQQYNQLLAPLLWRGQVKEGPCLADISEDADERVEAKKSPVEKEEETLVGSFTKLDVNPEAARLPDLAEGQQAHPNLSQSWAPI